MKPALVLVVIAAVSIGLIFFLNQCGRPTPPEVGSVSAAVSYDGTVYYFEAVSDFGSKLASFVKEHPELRVVSMAPLDNGIYGSTRGYWVLVEKREAKKE